MKCVRWFIVASAIVLALSAACPAFAATGNAGCLTCHAVGGEALSQLDFNVGVDMTKCNSCHWYSVHDFDDFHVAQNAAPNYMSQQCNMCHHSQTTFPTRPVIMGYPTAFTAFGWFQSPASVTATAGALHAIHANGSWLKNDPECNSCHGAAACTACHTEPDATHSDHADLGIREMPSTVRIGKQYGDVFGDTYLYQTYVNTNYDSGTALFVGRTSSGEQRMVLRIPLKKVEALSITSATLNFTRSSGAAFPMRAYRLRRSDWNFGQATWNAYKTGAAWGAPGAQSSALDYYADVYAQSSDGTFDVTALAQAARAAGSQYLDLLIVDPAPVARRTAGFYASNGAYPAWYPWVEIKGSQPINLYAYGPVSGTEPGNEELPAYVTPTKSCIADACHALSKVQSPEFRPQCLSCHPEKGVYHGYSATIHMGSPSDESIAISGKTYGPMACVGCHNVELGAEHVKATSSSAAAGCAACHPNPRMSFPVWDKSCSQGGCHVDGTSTQEHTGIDAAHVYPASPAGCNSANCHDATNVAELHKNASTVVGGQTRTSCAVCHSDGVPVKQDCVVCHPGDPHGDTPGLHPITPDPSCNGSKCHAGTSLIPIHANTQCGGCHASTDSAVLAAITNGDTRCVACHDVANAHGDLTALHTVTPYTGQIDYMVGYHQDFYLHAWIDGICGDCHVTPNAAAMHENDCALCHGGAEPAASFTTWNQTCQQGACHPAMHDAASPAHLALGDDSGQCNNCHNVIYETDSCGNCHGIKDTLKPTTTSNALSAYVGTATIKLAATDAYVPLPYYPSGVARTYYRVDNGAKVIGNTITIAPPTTGTASHTIEFWSVDKAGNFETPHKFKTFTVTKP